MPGSKKPGRSNLHASALVIGETGIVITGRSGSGKSRLALDLVAAAGAAGRFAAFVADDQIWLEPAGRRLIAAAPEAIAGLAEIRGSALVRVPYLRRAVMHLVLSIGPEGGQSRLPAADERIELAGVSLPLIHLRSGQLQDPLTLLDAFEQRRLMP